MSEERKRMNTMLQDSNAKDNVTTTTLIIMVALLCIVCPLQVLC